MNNFQLNSGPAPDLENRRRGPQVAVTVTGNECLTRGPRPAPSDASRRKATQGALANPCSGGNSEPRYLPGYRTPYRYVNSAAFNTAGRFPSNVTVPSSQFSWQEGADQGAFYWPYFYPWGSWGGFSGYDYYPNLYLPCPEAIPSSSSSITKTVSQENGSLPLVAGIRTTPNIQGPLSRKEIVRFIVRLSYDNRTIFIRLSYAAFTKKSYDSLTIHRRL